MQYTCENCSVPIDRVLGYACLFHLNEDRQERVARVCSHNCRYAWLKKQHLACWVDGVTYHYRDEKRKPVDVSDDDLAEIMNLADDSYDDLMLDGVHPAEAHRIAYITNNSANAATSFIARYFGVNDA